MSDLDGERRDAPAGTFNLACCESLAGRTSDAMTISGWRPSAPRLRVYARDDSDFDPIRDEPAFREIVGG